MGTQAGEAARAYHGATKHSEESLRRSRHFLDFQTQPIPFKVYQGLEPLLLARDWSPLEVPALEALLLGREGAESGPRPPRIPGLASIARLLYLSAGITKRKHHPGGEVFFRAAPNTGALYHIDLYLVCGELPDLAAGVYHFAPHDFGLRLLRAGDHRAVLVEASGGEPALARSSMIVVSASTYWRNAWKYQARAYRHCFWDAGTLHANLLAAATTEQLRPSIVTGFADRPVEQLLGLDVAKEGALTLVALGSSDAPPKAPAPLHDLALDTEPLSRSEVDYPAIREMHAASSLATGADAAVWRKAPCVRPLPAVKGRSLSADPLPAEKLPVESLESVIRRRGSTRAFERGSSLSLAELSTALERASAPLPTDFSAAPSTALVDLYLIVHAVEGVPAGAYFYSSERGALELLREGDFRVTAGRLGLHQQLPADAAVNVYCLTDLEAVLEARGNRGYRAAQLEGGIRGGLLYLAAYALRFGATGLTFLDDEVIEFFSPHARGKSVMFLTALGRSVRQR